jgi:hypothetical protein
MTPIQGDWTISSIGLPASALRKIYFDNARRLLVRTLPLPTAVARRVAQDPQLDGTLDEPAWQETPPLFVDYATGDGAPMAGLSTTVRVLWSERFLHLAYDCPYTELTTYEPPDLTRERFDMARKGVSLWDRDVVEAFINADPDNLRHYTEFQVAPTNERLDLRLRLPERDFAWSSGFESAVRIDGAKRRWQAEIRIPLGALSATSPSRGTRWRINFFRCDRRHNAVLTWNPTLQASFHVPERFGTLEFQ